MLVHIGSIKGRKSGTLSVHFLDDEPEPPTEQVRFAPGTPLEVTARVTNAGAQYRVKGSIAAQLVLTCSRCLRDFTREFHTPLEEFFRPVDAVADVDDWMDSAEEIDLDEESEPFTGQQFDLGPVVRERLLLALPMKQLCHQACAGICPQCGGNLNDVTCDCEDHDVDPRLAALQNWGVQTDLGDDARHK